MTIDIDNFVYYLVITFQMTPDEGFLLDKHPSYKNIVFGAGFSGIFIYGTTYQIYNFTFEWIVNGRAPFLNSSKRVRVDSKDIYENIVQGTGTLGRPSSR